MKFYAILNDENLYYKKSYMNPWVKQLDEAFVYRNPVAAKSLIIKLSIQTGRIPKLVVLEANIIDVIDQNDRVNKVLYQRQNKLNLENIKRMQYEAEIERLTSKLRKLK